MSVEVVDYLSLFLLRKKNADYADAGFQPAQRVAVARKLATCCRSRFGVAFLKTTYLNNHVIFQRQLQSGCDSRFRRRRNSDELRER